MEALQQSNFAPPAALEILREAHPLARQIGCPSGLNELVSGASTRPGITSPALLDRFLRSYVSELLIPFELPVIYQAYMHAARGHVIELLALDEQLADEPLLQPFAIGSELAGREQLMRLRPLKDQRVVQKYLQALEMNGAHGWHTLVYGLVLAIYSIPLRQGLLHYAQRTLQSFLQSASTHVTIDAAACARLTNELLEAVPAAIDEIITRDAWLRRQTG